MNKFIKYSLLFCLPIIIVAISLEITLRQIPNTYKYKYEWMQNNAKNVEILILGSSHTFYGIRPLSLGDKAFNLANVSQGAMQDLYLLKKWSDKYKQLKTVIFPISFFSLFSHGLEEGSEAYRCRYYKIYMDCDLYPNLSLYNFELSDIGTARRKLQSIFDKKGEDYGCDPYGWGTEFKIEDKDINVWNSGEEADAAVERHTVKDWDAVNHNISVIKEMVDFCKQHGIQLVLITTPCWESYYTKLNPKQLNKMYELTAELQQEYNIPYYDYLTDDRFVADDFFDSNHLSDVGAEKFTKILKADIGL